VNFTTLDPRDVWQDEAAKLPVLVSHLEKFKRIVKGAKPDRISHVSMDLNRFNKREFAFDFEIAHERVLSAAFGWSGPQQTSAASFNLQTMAWRDEFRRIFSGASLVVVQNGAFDLPYLEKHCGIRDVTAWDTMWAGYLLQPDGRRGLSHLVSLSLDVEAWKHRRAEDLLRYNDFDAGYTWILYQRLRKKLAETSQLEFFEKRLMPLLNAVVIPLDQRGLTVDEFARRKLLGEGVVEEWLARLLRHCEEAGLSPPLTKKKTFSHARAKTLLGNLGLELPRSPTTGRPTLDRSALRRLQLQDTTGTVVLLLEQSMLKERKSQLTFKINGDGRVRPRYVMGGKVFSDEPGASRAKPEQTSYHLASREPNLQAIPFKEIFIVSHPEWWLVEASVPELETRLLAEFASDDRLQEALDGDLYLHTLFEVDQLCGLYGLRTGTGPASGVEEVRRGFLGWCRRMGFRKLAGRYGLDSKRAKTLLQALDHLYRPCVEFWARQTAQARSEGKLTNRYGRRRLFPIVVEEEAAGFLVKSTAADLLFEAQLELRLGEGHLLAVSGSSTLAEGPDRKELAERLREAFKSVFKGLPLEIRSGKNWGELK
jgi:hypothetical protein